ncbi:MAG: GPW/gp25 family protein [Methylobacterium sp.]|nr:GPW/gp25 family protein [Methylobacterium sp.]
MAALNIPFAFDGRGRAATTGEEDHARHLIRMVLFTAPGERVNRPDFGCGLRQLVFAPLSDALAATTQHLVQGALLRWLGDVLIVNAVEVSIAEATLFIEVRYTLRASGQEASATFTRPVPP